MPSGPCSASFVLDLNSFFSLHPNQIGCGRWARSHFFVIVHELHLFLAEIGYFTWIWPDAKCNMRNAISKWEAVKWSFLNVYSSCNIGMYNKYYCKKLQAYVFYTHMYLYIPTIFIRNTTRGRRMGRWQCNIIIATYRIYLQLVKE